MSEYEVPDDLRYTSEHEWVKKIGPREVRIGITDYAQSALDDVVFAQLPAAEDEVAEGVSFAELESTKSVSDIFGPINGSVSAVNTELEAHPELVNSDPYGAGWLVEITVSDDTELDTVLADLLDAQGYRSLTE
ncbi:glycine cleavage system protein GcvH [Gordonia jinhuaensis]|uniref:Glycine cleavage system H protein n=1 Tax=Gordonia jinhuaensis TaxID=1517702 RepID=A0A916TIB2_9ACTN|nr:glycine cleavage system protein GcvH [Gordonia jinhuaensis]GGB45698.1 glycine cleavage system H protein [Gordonia jinhuaensis]